MLFETAVPALASALARGLTPQQARLDTLFHIMAVLDDSNLAHRGGLAGLRYAQRRARQFLDEGGAAGPEGLRKAQSIASEFVAQRLSPGGAADMLSAAMLDHARVRQFMSFALLFSGQGTQHPAMLPWLADDGLVHDTCSRLGVDDWRHALADPAWAQRNDNAQTLLTGLALAAWNQLAPQVASPAAVAGYSVGELAAFSAAGVIDPETAAALAAARAQAMDRCAAQAPGGLLAVSGLAETRLERLRLESGLAIAIRNGIESVILGGPHAALDAAERMASLDGAQCTRLRINVASHTPWMREAAESFSRTLAACAAPCAARRVVQQRRRPHQRCSRLRASRWLPRSSSTVRWDDCMENVAARQVTCVLEVGPGQALARMWNQRFPTIPARACDDFRSAAAIAAWLNSHSGDSS